MDHAEKCVWIDKRLSQSVALLNNVNAYIFERKDIIVTSNRLVTNPILPGFHPDPVLCRVGADYYMAVSTFEWYPGVRIYHSRTLADWRLVATPLNRKSLLDMRGCPDSCGVWAPCLTHADGRFWLVYTVVKRFDGFFKDTHNYVTTCATLDGVWSEPVYLNSSGFDPSLFHDGDGRTYLLNMVWDHRPDRSNFGGILCQEYETASQSLIGDARLIFSGTEAGCTEGPHLYKKNGCYYLMTAEGGTGYDHCVTMARSRSIWGPYTVDPSGPVLTAKGAPDHPIQRAGHGSLCDTQTGDDYYLAHLMSRPLPTENGSQFWPQDRQQYGPRSPMGRETGLQRLTYTADGWFRLADGGTLPAETVMTLPVDGAGSDDDDTGSIDDDFNATKLDPCFQWLRTPQPEDIFSLTARPGFLRLYGRESLGSLFTQSLVATRQTSFHYSVRTCVDFTPETFQQMAGLVAYYNAHKHHYLYIGYDESIGRYLGILSCLADQTLTQHMPLLASPIPLESDKAVHLRMDCDGAAINCFWCYDSENYGESCGENCGENNGKNWQQIHTVLDASLLSDEAGKGEGANFTGTFLGMACQDLSGQSFEGQGKAADFDSFHYRNL